MSFEEQVIVLYDGEGKIVEVKLTSAENGKNAKLNYSDFVEKTKAEFTLNANNQLKFKYNDGTDTMIVTSEFQFNYGCSHFQKMGEIPTFLLTLEDDSLQRNLTWLYDSNIVSPETAEKMAEKHVTSVLSYAQEKNADFKVVEYTVQSPFLAGSDGMLFSAEMLAATSEESMNLYVHSEFLSSFDTENFVYVNTEHYKWLPTVKPSKQRSELQPFALPHEQALRRLPDMLFESQIHDLKSDWIYTHRDLYEAIKPERYFEKCTVEQQELMRKIRYGHQSEGRLRTARAAVHRSFAVTELTTVRLSPLEISKFFMYLYYLNIMQAMACGFIYNKHEFAYGIFSNGTLQKFVRCEWKAEGSKVLYKSLLHSDEGSLANKLVLPIAINMAKEYFGVYTGGPGAIEKDVVDHTTALMDMGGSGWIFEVFDAAVESGPALVMKLVMSNQMSEEDCRVSHQRMVDLWKKNGTRDLVIAPWEKNKSFFAQDVIVGGEVLGRVTAYVMEKGEPLPEDLSYVQRKACVDVMLPRLAELHRQNEVHGDARVRNLVKVSRPTYERPLWVWIDARPICGSEYYWYYSCGAYASEAYSAEDYSDDMLRFINSLVRNRDTDPADDFDTTSLEKYAREELLRSY